MTITSFNIRGLGSGNNRTALKRFIETSKPRIVMLQETMMSTSSSCDFFLRIKPYWRVCTFDATGHSGGTLIA